MALLGGLARPYFSVSHTELETRRAPRTTQGRRKRNSDGDPRALPGRGSKAGGPSPRFPLTRAAGPPTMLFLLAGLHQPAPNFNTNCHLCGAWGPHLVPSSLF